jgi:hypothetical protein
MPLLYGEGHRAFERLQQEILRTSADQSILAFEAPIYLHYSINWVGFSTCLLAEYPSWFPGPPDLLINDFTRLETPMTLSSAGIELDLYIAPCFPPNTDYIAVLMCSKAGDIMRSPGFLIEEVRDIGNSNV